MTFKEWYEKEIGSENKPEYEAAKWAWDFQQAKIDELNEVVNGWKDEYRIMTLRYEKSKKQIDEQQKKLDCCREENKALLRRLGLLQVINDSLVAYKNQLLDEIEEEV